MAFLADAVTNRAFFDVTPELLSFHAAALRVGEAAAAISALSTGGKSTTAIACARRGMGLYSDERCVLRDGRVQAFPRAVNIRQGGLELLSSEDVHDDEGIGLRLRAHLNDDWISASFAELIGDRPRSAPAKLEAIFFIVARKTIPSVKLMPLGEAIVRLLSAGLCGPKPGLDRVAAAAALCRQSRAYELTIGTPDDTALLIGATMQPASPSLALGL
jgi:hypothetical protein